MSLELYGTASCPYTRELRESLEWNGRDFIEYDVEADPEAYARLYRATGQRTVPVLMDDGKVLAIGWQGRGCVVVPPEPSSSSPSP
jgi:mycoredoxin